MLLSISPKHKGIVIDTNVLSLLASAQRLDLLFQIAAFPLYVTPAIVKEVRTGVKHGVVALKGVTSLIQADKLQVLRPNRTEQAMLAGFPNKLGLGEKEAIAICQQRQMIFATHDRRAADYCDHTGISCIRLTELLARLFHASVLTQTELNAILT